MVSLEDAVRHILASKSDWGTERISLEQSLGRVLAEDVFADRDYPPMNRATMDGYAVKSQDIQEKQIKEFRIIGEVFAGDHTTVEIHSGEAVKIMTGAAVPNSADAVIKKEDAQETNGVVLFEVKDAKPLQFIARKGQDLSAGALAVKKHTQIHAGSFSLLAALGKSSVEVMRLPKAAILSIGNEVLPVDTLAASYQIRDSNSYTISALLKSYGVQSVTRTIVRDELPAMTEAIRSVLEYDLLMTSGGVSAGDADFVPDAMKQCGVKEIFYKVKIKPGKPLWFGVHPNGLRVFALPGNPFSVQVACKIFVEHFLRACFGLPAVQPLVLSLNTASTKKTPFDEFFPAKLVTDRTTQIEPLVYHTSGDITAALFADGIARHPAETVELAKGSSVEFYTWK